MIGYRRRNRRRNIARDKYESRGQESRTGGAKFAEAAREYAEEAATIPPHQDVLPPANQKRDSMGHMVEHSATMRSDPGIEGHFDGKAMTGGRHKTAIALSRAVETEIGGFVPTPGFD